MTLATVQSAFRDKIAQPRWQRAKNVGNSTIPAFGAVQITGTVIVGNFTILKVQKPDSGANSVLMDYGVGGMAFNGPRPIPSDGEGVYGKVTWDFPLYGVYKGHADRRRLHRHLRQQLRSEL